jgi:hypothetical protein
MRFVLGVRVQGMEGVEIPVGWQMYTEEGRPLSNDAFRQEGAAAVEPRSRDHARTFPVWVPTPFRPGRYLIRFTLGNPEGGPPLAESRAVPFTFEA